MVRVMPGEKRRNRSKNILLTLRPMAEPFKIRRNPVRARALPELVSVPPLRGPPKKVSGCPSLAALPFAWVFATGRSARGERGELVLGER